MTMNEPLSKYTDDKAKVQKYAKFYILACVSPMESECFFWLDALFGAIAISMQLFTLNKNQLGPSPQCA